MQTPKTSATVPPLSSKYRVGRSSKGHETGERERIMRQAEKSGIVLAANVTALLAEARQADAVMEINPLVGDFLATGEPGQRIFRPSVEASGFPVEPWPNDIGMINGMIDFGE